MRHIIHKAFWDYEKEEKWLNEMAAKGFSLISYTWFKYTFEETEKGEYVYRIEMLENMPSHAESQKYIDFLEETGVQYVTSYLRWVYFRKKASDGPFNLYSDIDSRIKHYQTVFRFWLVLMIAELLIGFSNLQLGVLVNHEKVGFNAYIGLPLLLFGLAILYFLVLPLNRKIQFLRKEKDIRE